MEEKLCCTDLYGLKVCCDQTMICHSYVFVCVCVDMCAPLCSGRLLNTYLTSMKIDTYVRVYHVSSQSVFPPILVLSKSLVELIQDALAALLLGSTSVGSLLS